MAGASGGMSAVFNTPMAAVLLAVEILLFEWKPRSLIPVALAAAVAALLRPYLLGSGAMFPVTPMASCPRPTCWRRCRSAYWRVCSPWR